VANSRSVETSELNGGNPYARSGRMDKHIVPVFDITNQDKSLKSFRCARSARSPERDSIWGQLGRTELTLTCDESLWNARSLHPRQLRRLAEDLRFRYSDKFCIGALNQEKRRFGKPVLYVLRTPAVLTHPRCETQDLVTYRPCR
jgi:hypothetical protein